MTMKPRLGHLARRASGLRSGLVDAPWFGDLACGVAVALLCQYLTAALPLEHGWMPVTHHPEDMLLFVRAILAALTSLGCFCCLSGPTWPALLGFAVPLCFLAPPVDLGWQISSPDDWFCVIVVLIAWAFIRHDRRRRRL